MSRGVLPYAAIEVSLVEGPYLQVSCNQPLLDGQAWRFKVPSMAQIAVHANRLLRFRPPVPYQHETHLRFLVQAFQTPGVSAKGLASWPEVWVEQVVQALWQAGLIGNLQPEATQVDWAPVLGLAHSLSEFCPVAWCRADMALLAQRPLGGVHAGAFLPMDSQTPLTAEGLSQVLQAHGYAAHSVVEAAVLAKEALVSPEPLLAAGYLWGRWLASPMPWQALIHQCDVTILNRLPDLQRLTEQLHGWKSLGGPPIDQPPTLRGLLHACRVLSQPALPASMPRPFRAAMLVEGATEALQMPYLLHQWSLGGRPDGQMAVAMIEAGGKNALASVYHQWSALLGIPIMVLADADAQPAMAALAPQMRAMDCSCVLTPGAWEDLYPLPWLVATLNRVYQPYPLLEVSTLAAKLSFLGPGQAVLTLQALWREYNWGAFDKVRFAKDMIETLAQEPHLLKADSRSLKQLKAAMTTFVANLPKPWWTPWC